MVKKTIIFVLLVTCAVGGGMLLEQRRSQQEPQHDAIVTLDNQVLAVHPIPDAILDHLEPVGVEDAAETVRQKQFDTLFGGSHEDFGYVAEIHAHESPFGFTVQYDSRFTTENAWVVLPGGERITAFAVVRYVPHTDCTDVAPEYCRPYTENPAIAFGVIGKSPRKVISEHLDVFAENLEPVTINGNVAAQYYASVDGEGVVTILMPLTDKNKTLIIQYTYDTKYDEQAPDERILPSPLQKVLIDSVLGTLTIR